MLRNDSVFVSATLTPAEQGQLRRKVRRIPAIQRPRLRQGIPAPFDRDTLLDLLEHATARAKGGFYLETAARLDRRGLEWAHHQFSSKRPRRKAVPVPALHRRARKTLQVAPIGNLKGRPVNTAAILLTRDVGQALRAVGLPCVGRASLLSKVTRVCAAVAKLSLPDDLKHVRAHAAGTAVV